MDNLGYLLAAYTVIWAVVFGYVLFMQRKQRRLQQQIDMLRDSIDDEKQ
ncbi:MAG: CcmD family protein [Dehalococcoidales bacterium]